VGASTLEEEKEKNGIKTATQGGVAESVSQELVGKRGIWATYARKNNDQKKEGRLPLR